MKRTKLLGAAALVLSVNAFSTNTIAAPDHQLLNQSPLASISDKDLQRVTDISSNEVDPQVRRAATLAYWYYQELLKRKPESGGYNYWVNEIYHRGCNATTLKDVIWGFTHSAEFNQQINAIQGSAQHIALVTRLYRAAFHRSPDEQGLTFWVQALESGAKSRDEVITGITTSAEFNQRSNTVCTQ